MGDIVRFYGPTMGILPTHESKRLVAYKNVSVSAPIVTGVVYGTLTAVITFNKPVKDSTTLNWAATVNALANVVVSAVISLGNVVTVTWTTPGVATNAVIIDYTQGTLALDRPAGQPILVATFQENGVIP